MSTAEVMSQEERDSQVFKLRLRGQPARSIAKLFGLTVTAVNEIVEAKMVKVDAKYKAQAQALDLERLESLICKLVSLGLNGDVEASSAAIRGLARRASILGYDSPVRIDATLEVTQTSTEYYEEVLRQFKAQVGPPRGEDGEPGKPN